MIRVSKDPGSPDGMHVADTAKCVGCVDHFYNGNNALGVKECWSLKTAQLVTRWRIHRDAMPARPGVFEEVEVYDCRREQGFSLYKELPSSAEAPTRIRRSRDA
jgi:hypothetical protein